MGTEKRIFYIHPFVLCKASAVFEARVKGMWKNVAGDALDWSKFTVETIECVVEYLYSGKYTAGKQSQDRPQAPDAVTGMLDPTLFEHFLTVFLYLLRAG